MYEVYYDNKGFFGTYSTTGMGRYIFPNGTIYEGEFVNGYFHGVGSITWNDGSYYHGDWQENQRSGVGVLYYNAYDDIEYVGNWESSLFNGEGIYRFPNGGTWNTIWLKGTYNDGNVVNLVYPECGTPMAKSYWKNNIFYGSYYENGEWYELP